MKKTLKIVLTIVLLMGVLFTLTACGKKKEVNSKKEDSIVGSWKNDDLGYDFIYTFNEDGTGNYDAAGSDMEFTYKIDGNKISILYTGNTESFDTEFKIDGDTLNVVDSLGNDTLYKRVTSKQETTKASTSTKKEQTGTAGSNIPIKDNHEEAEYQIKVAFQDWLAETYGDEVFDARIYVEKIYSAEEEQKEPLKSYNLGPDEVAFEVKYELKLAEGVDPNKFTAATGVYDEESGWVKEKYNIGILRLNSDGSESKYKITDLGTGW